MQTIHKYRLGRKNNVPVEVSMPVDSIPIHAAYDFRTQEFCVWAICMNKTEITSEERTFYVAGTGHDLANKLDGDEVMVHINSFAADPSESGLSGWFHCFEVCDKKDFQPQPDNA